MLGTIPRIEFCGSEYQRDFINLHLPIRLGELMTNVVLDERKLHDEAHEEAERHKWIESQKCGHDRGKDAIQEWYLIHWPIYCRCKRLEHLQGMQRWDEFEDERFGSLSDLIKERDLLVEMICDRITVGYENLSLIQWAYNWGLCVEKVVAILVLIDVNRARLDPEVR